VTGTLYPIPVPRGALFAVQDLHKACFAACEENLLEVKRVGGHAHSVW